ncbi:hypothetical protein GOODEAATRI_025717, partial [Goodea atripinnis]
VPLLFTCFSPFRLYSSVCGDRQWRYRYLSSCFGSHAVLFTYPVEHALEELLLNKGSDPHCAIGREQSSLVVPSPLLIPTKKSLDLIDNNN